MVKSIWLTDSRKSKAMCKTHHTESRTCKSMQWFIAKAHAVSSVHQWVKERATPFKFLKAKCQSIYDLEDFHVHHKDVAVHCGKCRVQTFTLYSCLLPVYSKWRKSDIQNIGLLSHMDQLLHSQQWFFWWTAFSWSHSSGKLRGLHLNLFIVIWQCSLLCNLQQYIKKCLSFLCS